MDNVTANSDASKARLRSYIERVERLEENKKEIAEDIKEVFKEAKSEGFDTKIMKQVIKLRKMDAEDRIMQEELLDIYKHALGMIFTDPTE
ncbi:MAG: DUF2312 domain-containing protein [Alphaproteobacteria bacterium]|nr:DUF2312 domain-containing protein [Alphaproteobacteria bacterium]MCV6599504.1 DUF2312 domain-containing protein [Alphaproteobacteria bacterium]